MDKILFIENGKKYDQCNDNFQRDNYEAFKQGNS